LTNLTQKHSSVLAIGIDAAESTFVRQMIEQDELPALGSLVHEGGWLTVRSPARIGGGCVWPTFLSGKDPSAHGIYSEWKWIPETMSLRRYHGSHLTPFWKALAEKGISVGVFDVPFASPVGISKGFEVCEWWAHDSTADGLYAGPDGIHSLVAKSPAHPLAANRFAAVAPDEERSLKQLARACGQGARLRGMLAQQLIKKTNPQVSIIVFPEVHHAAHQLWHTATQDHPIYKRLISNGRRFEPLLREVYRTVDQQIGGIIQSSNAETVMVFALHGIRPALGFPGFLVPLMCELGFSKRARWRSQTSRQRFASLFAATKRHAPARLRKLYYEMAPATATYKLARPTMLPAYDWRNTRAFCLPTEQYGWIRINLVGREAEGIVAPEEYDELCAELEQMLFSLSSEDGELLVQDISRTSENSTDAVNNPLPDLVVRWRDAASGSSLKIKGSNVQPQLVSRKVTGQHAPDGFCIFRGTHDWRLKEVVDVKELSQMIATSLET
jgi:predicted AlkP superfamily phosphohydrolase/phosphomutase